MIAIKTSAKLKIDYSTFQNILFGLLLISGTIKPFFNTYLFEINLTLIIFSIVLMDMIFNSFIRPIKISTNNILYTSTLIIFHVLIFISLLYSKSESYRFTKAFNFFINYLFLLYPLFIIQFKPKLFFQLLFLTIIPLSIWFTFQRYLLWLPGTNSAASKFYDLRTFYLNLGAIVGVLIIYFSYYKKWLLVSICLLTMLGLSARGPLIFSLFIVFIINTKRITSFINEFVLTPKVLLFIIFLVSSTVIALWKYYDILNKIIFETLFLKLSGLFQSYDGSITGRFDRLNFAFDHIFNSFSSVLFGHGIGSFGIMYTGEDLSDYPHNLFVEAWFELGVFGLLISLLIFLVPFFFKGEQIYKYLAFYFLLQGLKSYSLTSIWVIFAFFGLILFYKTRKKLT